MSEECREQRPLLCESAEDEDVPSQQWDARRRRIGPRSERARCKLEGAATVFQQWPNYWTSSLYLWFGMASLCLLFFVIYNNALAFSYTSSLKSSTAKGIQTSYDNSPTDENTSPQVYMHVFTESRNNINLKKYEPHIDVLTEEYKAFDFNLFILLNDTITSKYKENSEEENNEQALNALLTDIYKNTKRTTDVQNVKVKYELLSNYLDNSPLGKQWRTFPKSFIPFLVRAVSIWDKGGIAFNPEILLPQPTTAVFVDKLHIIMKGYKKFNGNQSEKEIKNKNELFYQKKKPNSIQDIMEALEQNEQSYKFNEINLTEAEAEEQQFNSRKLTSFNNKNTEENKRNFYNDTSKYENDNKNRNNSLTNVVGANVLAKNSGKSPSNLMDKNLFSNIFNTIFHEANDKPRGFKNFNIKNRSRKSTAPNFIPNRISDVKGLYYPLVMPQGSKYGKKYYPPKDMNFEQDKLTIDLKGNIIATETPCHAFIGTLFSNTFHHYEEESVTDFIVAELSYFCKGTLSACKGINLILV